VVDAYWIGNGLLRQVEPGAFHESLRGRFAARMPVRDFGWLAGKLGTGATPHHNFHVFEVYSRAGLMNGDRSGPVLDVMDSCRISWGEVTSVRAQALTVRRRPLVLQEGKLRLGPAAELDVEAFADTQVRVGDRVAVHWGWACEVLRPSELGRLQAATSAALERCNQTL